jgi:hypothetical protein
MSRWRLVVEVEDPDNLPANDVRESVEDAIRGDTYMRVRRVTIEPVQEESHASVSVRRRSA